MEKPERDEVTVKTLQNFYWIWKESKRKKPKGNFFYWELFPFAYRWKYFNVWK